MNKHLRSFLNIAFILLCTAILVFLLKAPEETTAKLPHDSSHERFFKIASKKEAEKYCDECHAPGMTNPLSEKHPPKYRCLFCHKREK